MICWYAVPQRKEDCGMKVLHLGNLKSGIDTYVRNTVALADERFEFVIVSGADDNSALYIRNRETLKIYKISSTVH